MHGREKEECGKVEVKGREGNRGVEKRNHIPTLTLLTLTYFYPSDPVSRRESSPIRSLRRVQISAGCGQRFGQDMTPKDPKTQKSNRQTFRHTDAPNSEIVVF